jgi:hypothetical protein
MRRSSVMLALFSCAHGRAVASVIVDVDASTVTHRLNPLHLGCHSDSGYVHQTRGFSSQMVLGESFEADHYPLASWSTLASANASGSATPDQTTRFHGLQSQRLQLTSAGPDGAGVFGLANRGLAGEGFFLEGGKPYEGYLFALAPVGGPPVSLTISLAHRASAADVPPLASVRMSVPADGEWQRLEFELTPTESTACEGITSGSDPTVNCGKLPTPASICVRCGGELRLTLGGEDSGEARGGEDGGGARNAGAGDKEWGGRIRQEVAAPMLNLDFVWLQPGAWGRLAGLPVLKSNVDILQEMGTRVIRLGGTFASLNPAYSSIDYQWQKWTGPVWARNLSIGMQFKDNLISSFGPFEFLDMYEVAGIEPVLTISMYSSVEEMAELVEYCWGPAHTPGGARRVGDGHARQYRLRYIELGNEQYNPNYVEQVRAGVFIKRGWLRVGLARGEAATRSEMNAIERG